MMKEIYLSKWDNLGARYLICRANIIGELGINFSECRVSFESNSDKIDMINTNKKDYVMKKVTIYTDGACSGNPGPRWLGSSAYVW